ncbi:MAG: hypothetical protein JWP09_570 [Candidatus Taylorbacteria bacterium]|nr:hypothetical protein [Candidatus Taylorbacteria bacterium]
MKKFAPPDFRAQRLFELRGEVILLPSQVGWGQMHHSDALGTDILCDTSGEKPFGLGWIKFPPNGEVKLHTHEGSHVLICFAGRGQVKVEINIPAERQSFQGHELSPGDCYSIGSLVAHSVHAGPDGLTLLVVGNDYRNATSTDRLQMVKTE